jgi:GTP cyclohydrolase I
MSSQAGQKLRGSIAAGEKLTAADAGLLRLAKPVSARDVESAVAALLTTLGVDLSDPNYRETPRRFGAYLLEHFALEDSLEEINKCSRAVFPSQYAGMILQNFNAVGMCPHHLLPVLYDGVVAYIPYNDTIGISKLSRIAQQCLRVPILQETGTLIIANALEEVLRSSNVAVMVRGQHMCMSIRGVKARDSYTTTSELRGDFMDDADTRAEFMSLARETLRGG